ncbi:hypothetical protein CLAFUW4_04844 [Fulvia fulva]|uniref:PLD phosphodiesterase domain-containing protein n=1 Tax=Passalora fulva TaxID=5499 RepID=A0A9Q8PIG5_PASFU|nr:uncharacterized protein CLAFUR5_12061 [Fulvia fulva]KAK4626866.1 hypothetical protein CLAFUR4_04830 [Fulvia fulva]KAK4627658.1 hypothetical protein CLAFUR0_04834 [Fulvia fulva]UJO23100.1 hypothetical protein CLAFUR5_12061 [Fulvia fulva]WPV14102.1 hypothetical protein CLAFUW4_04844 [Fulvia fulva]WPV28488.1 hypothetical protein CLAFUW7_04838 [Fulvia fulva]
MSDHQAQANIHNVTFGTGYDIYKHTILPAIEAAQDEVILITCFWARSQTLDALNESLLRLSSNALRYQKKIKVRIGFSSGSLFQKLLSTSSPAGHTYDASQWSKKLWLPSREDLGGLDLEVKSIFFLPLSVWHPKFVIVDGRRVFLPSCNVSWEDWFEGCVEMSGPLVEEFQRFWREQWANDGENRPAVESAASQTFALNVEDVGDGAEPSIRMTDITCKFLPSWHNRNPNWRLPLQQCAPPPETPLNVQLLELFATAKQEIFLQTPNVTAPPVLDALLHALKRGIDVKITTSERLMILEQLVTAGTTTDRCMKALTKEHERLLYQPLDEESGLATLGRLEISYYKPRREPERNANLMAEPVQSHLKLMIVDNSTIVFGSGNMDRASWYTSQELGVAFFSEKLCQQTRQKLKAAMEGRTKILYGKDQTWTTRRQ